MICGFYFTALQTRHAAGISSKIKGNEVGVEIKPHTVSIQLADSLNKK